MNISVLSLGWEYPPNIEGGLGIAYLGLNKALSKKISLRGIVPGLASAGGRGRSVEVRAEDSFEVHPVSVQHPIGSYANGSSSYLHIIERAEVVLEEIAEGPIENNPLASEFEAFFSDASWQKNPIFKSIYQYTEKTLSEVKGLGFHVIHAHDWMTFLAAFELRRIYNVPVVLHIHSLEFDRNESPWDSWIFEFEKKALEHADAVISVSAYTKKILVDEYEIDSTKISVVHNGLEPVTPFRTPKVFPEKLILFLGRLTYQKGPELFIEMAKEILKSHQDVRFVIGGKGDQLPEIVNYVAEARIGDRVHFTGHLSRTKVYELLSMADVFVMPSVSEPFGLVALEAAQFGVPCIISKNSGLAEIFPTSSTADPGEVNQWVGAIMGLLQFPEWREEQVKEVQERIAPLSWENAADKTLQVYDKVLG
ncbi:MAG: glycosyltransferase family 4 protein [Bacteroidota bacterium]